MKRPISFTISDDICTLLDQEAAQQDRSRSWVADRAIREWLAGRSAPNAVDGAEPPVRAQ
jgi:predicted transcriptional regulator